MGSYDYGKKEIVEWVKENFPKGSTCLDVGACDGKWARLLGDYLTMDAVEIFPPNGARLNGYRRVLIQDIVDYTYEHYDLIIFGDVIEHMTVKKAQRVLEYAYPRCKDMIIGVPFLYHQDELYGNPWEKHIQDDLTEENFAERYPQYKLLYKAASDYAYYIKGEHKVACPCTNCKRQKSGCTEKCYPYKDYQKAISGRRRRRNEQ